MKLIEEQLAALSTTDGIVRLGLTRRFAGHEVRRISYARCHLPRRPSCQTRGRPQGSAGDGNRTRRADQPFYQCHCTPVVRPGAEGCRHRAPRRAVKGVPYLIKDLGFFETGEPATLGSSLFKDFVANPRRY